MSRGSERALIAAVAIGALGLVIAVAALAGVFSSDDGDDPQVDSGFGSIDAPEPDSGPPPPRVRRYEIAGRPDTISAGAGYVWVADSLDGTLQRINPDSKRPIAVDVAGFPTDVSAGEGGAWLALADRGAIQRVSGNEGPGPPVDVAGFPFQIAAGEGAVWAMSQNSVERVDPSAQEADDPIDLDGELSAIAAGEGGVWVVRSNSEVVKLDPGSGEHSEAVEVPGAFNVTIGESAVWALGASAGDGSRRDADPHRSGGGHRGQPHRRDGRRRRRGRARLRLDRRHRRRTDPIRPRRGGSASESRSRSAPSRSR